MIKEAHASFKIMIRDGLCEKKKHFGITRKPVFFFACAKNKGADQLWPFQIKPLAIFYGYTAQFVSDLVGNPKARFSHDEAHLA